MVVMLLLLLLLLLLLVVMMFVHRHFLSDEYIHFSLIANIIPARLHCRGLGLVLG